MHGDVVANIDFMMECNMLEIGSGLDTLAFTPKAGAMNRYQPSLGQHGIVSKKSITSKRLISHDWWKPFHLQPAMHVRSMSKPDCLWKYSHQSTNPPVLLGPFAKSQVAYLS